MSEQEVHEPEPEYSYRRGFLISHIINTVNVVLVAIALISLFLVNQDTNTVSKATKKVANDTNGIVEFVKEQTSPEAQAKQDKLLHQVLVTVDCNSAQRLQVGFDQLADQGVIKRVDVTSGCK